MKSKTLAAWLEKHYAAWQPTQNRHHRSLTAFANYLGISQPLLSSLVNGKRTSISEQTAGLIANKLGDEIYDLIGVPRPDPALRRMSTFWSQLTPDQQRGIAEKVERYARENRPPYDECSKGG